GDESEEKAHDIFETLTPQRPVGDQYANITQFPTTSSGPLNDSATLYMHTVNAFPKTSEELVDYVKEETCRILV
ncbi:hypothetical protein BC941DRAFT_445778, partial [Chlamydoabsidia padenii]